MLSDINVPKGAVVTLIVSEVTEPVLSIFAHDVATKDVNLTGLLGGRKRRLGVWGP